MFEDGECGGEPEIVVFYKLYNINIHVFDVMTSSTPIFHSWKQYLHSYNIFIVDKQQSFWFVVDNRGFKKFDFKMIKKESIKRRLQF